MKRVLWSWAPGMQPATWELHTDDDQWMRFSPVYRTFNFPLAHGVPDYALACSHGNGVLINQILSLGFLPDFTPSIKSNKPGVLGGPSNMSTKTLDNLLFAHTNHQLTTLSNLMELPKSQSPFFVCPQMVHSRTFSELIDSCYRNNISGSVLEEKPYISVVEAVHSVHKAMLQRVKSEGKVFRVAIFFISHELDSTNTLSNASLNMTSVPLFSHTTMHAGVLVVDFGPWHESACSPLMTYYEPHVPGSYLNNGNFKNPSNLIPVEARSFAEMFGTPVIGLAHGKQFADAYCASHCIYFISQILQGYVPVHNGCFASLAHHHHIGLSELTHYANFIQSNRLHSNSLLQYGRFAITRWVFPRLAPGSHHHNIASVKYSFNTIPLKWAQTIQHCLNLASKGM